MHFIIKRRFTARNYKCSSLKFARICARSDKRIFFPIAFCNSAKSYISNQKSVIDQYNNIDFIIINQIIEN